MHRVDKALFSLLLSFLILLGFSSYSPALTPPVNSYLSLINESLISPLKVAVDHAGNVYVADMTTRMVTVFDSVTGQKKFAIASSDVPRSVAVDYQGRILVGYMNDGQPGYVVMYDSAGQGIRMLGAGHGEFVYPVDIAVSYPSGRVHVLDSMSNMVKVFDSNGDHVLLSDGSPFYFGGYGSNNGNSVLSNPGKFWMPTGIAVDNIRQEVLVSDQNNNRVHIFDMNGTFKTAFGKYAAPNAWMTGTDLRGKFGAIKGLTVDNEGRIYVADAAFGHIQVLDRLGNFIVFIGAPGYGPGQMYVPYDVVIDNLQRLIVIDPYVRRVTLFKIDAGPAMPNVAPAIPVPSAPLMDAILTTPMPILSVENSKDLNNDVLAYRFEIDTSSLFASGSLITLTVPAGPISTSLQLPELPQGTYFWRVRAEEASTPEHLASDWSDVRTFTVYLNKPPSVPQPVSPSAGSILTTPNPTLAANNSTDPNNDTLVYKFQIDTSSSFTSGSLISLIVSAGATSTSVQLPALPQGSYFWRVRAEEASTLDHLTSDWSGVGTFDIYLNKPPTVPTNLTPDMDSRVKKTDSFGWKVSTDPDTGDDISYVLEVADQTSFENVLITQPGLASATFSIDTLVARVELKPDMRYLWRVRAVDNHGASSAWSSTASFIFTQTRLFVNSVPAGASVYLDGNYSYLGTYLGETGSSHPAMVDLRPGRHVVRIEKAGYFGYYKSIVVSDGGSYTLEAILQNDVIGKRTFKGALRDNLGAAIGGEKRGIPAAKPFMVDWNNDGRKDLLLGSGDGRVYLYINVGTDVSPVFRLSPEHQQGVITQVTKRAVPFVVDWDNDGRKDLLVGSGDGMVWMYLNHGSDESPSFAKPAPLTVNNVPIRVRGNAAPFVVDWNGDRKKDLLVGENSGGVRLFINKGFDSSPVLTLAKDVIQGASTQQHKTLEAVPRNAVPFVCDWNMDGRKDLLVGTTKGLQLYLNTSSNIAPVFDAVGTVSLGNGDIAPLALDLENDGYPDMLVGVDNGHIHYYPFRKMTGDPQNAFIKSSGKSVTKGDALYNWW